MAIGFGINLYSTKKSPKGNLIFRCLMKVFEAALDNIGLSVDNELRLRFLQNRCRETRRNILAKKYIDKWRRFIELKLQKHYVEVYFFIF